ncbi:lysophospholipid acyltransferase family protein [Thalassoroseus pseudoceratinae]|uniref:lysophospholipid acyltransferase family protein n=1 Tax=Thalassoroseus pseudoceratinae TaxID=2713176 RepID=UPI0014235137|nr:lysophospholipid acyltransferase family protein [Thalassoroseus pseudoceratinae]
MPKTKTDSQPEATPHPTRRNLYWLTIQFILRMFFTLRFRYRARGLENIPDSGGGLVLSNHQSSLDPLLIGLPLSRPVSFLARDTLFPIPVMGHILRKTYVMPINRDAASTATIRTAVGRMKHGFLVGIFPEGTRSRDGKIGKIKPGFIALARRSGLPVFPVGIAGANGCMPSGSIWPRQGHIHVVFGEPLSQDDLADHLKKGREEELTALIHERLTACQQAAEDWRSREMSGS